MRKAIRHLQPSLPGLTRQSIPLREKMDARVKPGHDTRIFDKDMR
jgi:hypothetical protein